jgi:hypothetical protein
MLRLPMTADKPTAIAVALIAFWTLVLATGIGTPHGWITTKQGAPVEGDYTGLYAAGKFALETDPIAAYDWERHAAAQRQLTGNPNGDFYAWPYPPSFLFVAAALALLPYYLSMLTWTLATFAAFAAALRRISLSNRDMLLMLAAPAAWLNLYVGQNGALTAALIGFGLVLLAKRPALAGVCIGLLAIKPHLGILIPVALIAGGYYRAFAFASLTVGALAFATAMVFGPDTWLAMPEQLRRVADLVKTTDATAKIQSLFGMARSLGLPADKALWLHFGLVALLIVLIARIWSRRGVSFDLKAAALAAAATLASPYQFVYDLAMLTIAQAFLLRHWACASVGRTESMGLLIANVLVFLFAATAVPLGFVASVLVMALILRRVWAPRRAARLNQQVANN